MMNTRVLNLAVEDRTKAGEQETSEVLESPQAAYLQAVVGGARSQVVAIGEQGWQRTPDTNDQWAPLPIEQVGSLLISLNVNAEAHCLQLERGRLRSVGTRVFARQSLRALMDDGSGAGGIQGTWYLTQKPPVRIVGFTGTVPTNTTTPAGCGSSGPGPIERLYSYDSAPPVTIPPGLSTAPTTTP